MVARRWRGPKGGIAMLAVPDLQGVFPPALTMFNANGDLDEGATARHIDYLISCGVHGLIACGSSGEFIALTEAERLRVIGIVIQAAAGRVPVYAGTGHYSTRLTIELTQAAEALGAAGAIVILPYYQRPTRLGLLGHYHELRRHTQLPIMFYDNPHNAASLAPTSAEIAELATAGVVQSVKSTHESIVPVQDLLALDTVGLRVFYGSFHAPLEALMCGAHGWISGFLNFLTRDCVALYTAAQASDWSAARQVWRRLLPFKQLYTHQIFGPLDDLAIYRAGLELLGQHGGYSRRPFQPLTEPQRVALTALMQKQGYLPH